MKKGKALVVFSGGQDSTTCLFWALNRYEEVHTISFNYGQKHSVELEQARKICDAGKVSNIVINIDFLGQIAESNLIGSDKDVNKQHSSGKNLPASWVPNRNVIFLTLAHAYAQKIGADSVVTGVGQADYSGYPDCREYVIKLLLHTLNDASESNIKIITPLMYLDKAHTFELALKLNCLDIVINGSHTCYNGDRSKLHDWGYGCGECPACRLRKAGWNLYITLLTLS